VSSERQIIKAMAIIRRPRDGALLVSESPEPLFQRPLGGHVEFGEYAADTIHREFLEEIGQVVTDVRLLGVLENIFGWRGGTEHEVVFIFAAAFASDGAYEIEEQLIRDDTEPKNRVIWRAADAVGPPLYPAGLSELIASSRELGRARMTTPQQFLIRPRAGSWLRWRSEETICRGRNRARPAGDASCTGFLIVLPLTISSAKQPTTGPAGTPGGSGPWG
jgi:ADP-ribose pyrophosphatase YjhB (NUDIX family)